MIDLTVSYLVLNTSYVILHARKPIFVLVTNDYNVGVGKFWRNVMATSKDTKIDLLVTTV